MDGYQGVELLTLEGLSGVAQTDYTRGEVFSIYQNVAQTIQSLPTPPNPNSPAYQAAITVLNAQLNQLLGLYKNGMMLPVDPTKPDAGSYRFYITVPMAQQLDLLLKTLQLADVDVTQPINMSATQAAAWQSYITLNPMLSSFYISASDSAAQTQSIQAAVELQYVKTGNDVMSSQIQDLESALITTKAVLNNLENILELHNTITIANRGKFTTVTGFNWTGVSGNSTLTPSKFVDSYQSAASSFFGGAIVPVIPGNPSYILPAELNWLAGYIQTQGSPVYSTSVTPAGWQFTTHPGDDPPVEATSAWGLELKSTLGNGDKVWVGKSDNSHFAALQHAISSTQRLANGSVYQIQNSILTFPSGDAVGLDYAYKEFLLQQTGLDDLKNQIVKARNDLDTQIAALQAIVGDTTSNALLSRLQNVRADFSAVFVTNGGAEITSGSSMTSAYGGLYNWLIDRYDKRNSAEASLAGQLQNNITFAITSGQALNDTKKAEVQNFLFVFQEYYRSAAAILQQVTQSIRRAAQSVSGR